MADELSSWEDFLAYIDANHTHVVRSGPNRARFQLSHRGRVELVLGWMQPSPTGTPWLGLGLSLGLHNFFRKRAALVANRRLPMGAFVLARESMLLTQTLPLPRLLVAHVDEALQALAETTAMLSTSASTEAPEDAPFAYVFTTRMTATP